MVEQVLAMDKSHGFIVNSFYELESTYVDYWSQKIGPKAWCVGPLCVAKPPSAAVREKLLYMQWLDGKFAEDEPVLYVSFGTQAKLSPEQLHEIATGLEKSQHKAVKGFLSHCGWNSVMESLSANVPILAFPMMAEQHLNARLVVEETGLGLRIMPSNGSVRGFVAAENVEKMVKEFMEGEKGKAVRRKVEEISDVACAATEEGGSSWRSLNFLIDDVCRKRYSQSYSHSSKIGELLDSCERQDLHAVRSK
ncbi:UDP-glycosyltransferase 90A1 [Abeliophyllum distichum]|uniref:UDP-glycosyltransferase 90A1 n=1 Tax=Abeliophyllum distichum TaxID=126358 RepID=A0ABD1RWB6_9LAMI